MSSARGTTRGVAADERADDSRTSRVSGLDVAEGRRELLMLLSAWLGCDGGSGDGEAQARAIASASVSGGKGYRRSSGGRSLGCAEETSAQEVVVKSLDGGVVRCDGFVWMLVVESRPA